MTTVNSLADKLIVTGKKYERKKMQYPKPCSLPPVVEVQEGPSVAFGPLLRIN